MRFTFQRGKNLTDKIITISFITGLLATRLLLGVAPQANQQTGAVELYKEAKLAIYQNQWIKAIKLLKAVITDFSDTNFSDESTYWLAYSQNKLGIHSADREQAEMVKKEAIDNINLLLKKWKNSQWVDDAKILRIKIYTDLVQLGNKRYLKDIKGELERAGDNESDLIAVVLDALIRLDVDSSIPFINKVIGETTNPELRTKIVFILNNSADNRLRKVREKMLVEKPNWIHKVNPIYPVEALRKKIEGEVLLEIVTNTKGEVLQATALKGPLLLREAAIKAVGQWRHEPNLEKAKPYKRIFTVSISFNID